MSRHRQAVVIVLLAIAMDSLLEVRVNGKVYSERTSAIAWPGAAAQLERHAGTKPRGAPARALVASSAALLAALLHAIGAAYPLGANAADLSLSERLLAKVAATYGQPARRRLRDWRELITSGEKLDEMDKLREVNDFFNRLDYISDARQWGREDYWATPVEFLSTRGGDCEDFSIAKYVTLREMGVPIERMKITYVKALTQNEAHMVLTYYPTPAADPLVLDNLDKRLLPGSRRPDLAPVYSFNGDGLWLAARKGQGQRVGSSDRISLWRDVAARMRNEHTP